MGGGRIPGVGSRERSSHALGPSFQQEGGREVKAWPSEEAEGLLLGPSRWGPARLHGVAGTEGWFACADAVRAGVTSSPLFRGDVSSTVHCLYGRYPGFLF